MPKKAARHPHSSEKKEEYVKFLEELKQLAAEIKIEGDDYNPKKFFNYFDHLEAADEEHFNYGIEVMKDFILNMDQLSRFKNQSPEAYKEACTVWKSSLGLVQNVLEDLRFNKAKEICHTVIGITKDTLDLPNKPKGLQKQSGHLLDGMTLLYKYEDQLKSYRYLLYFQAAVFTLAALVCVGLGIASLPSVAGSLGCFYGAGILFGMAGYSYKLARDMGKNANKQEKEVKREAGIELGLLFSKAPASSLVTKSTVNNIKSPKSR